MKARRKVEIRRVQIVLGADYDEAEYTIYPRSGTVEVRNLFPTGEPADCGKVTLDQFLEYAEQLKVAARSSPPAGTETSKED